MQPSKVILLFQQTMWITSNCFYGLDLILWLHYCAMFFCLHANPGGWIKVRVLLDRTQVVLLPIINHTSSWNVLDWISHRLHHVKQPRLRNLRTSPKPRFSSALIALHNLHGKRSLTKQAELWVEPGAHVKDPGGDVSPHGKAPWPSLRRGHENTT